MKFAVRYWSSLLPREFREHDGQPIWQEYSLHPASKLGLHNAMLAVHDRLEILQTHGGQYECAVFVVEEDKAEKLSPESANQLFATLPDGEVKWLDIGKCLLPSPPETLGETSPPARQLVLFTHTHTPYDDLEATPHRLDIDV